MEMFERVKHSSLPSHSTIEAKKFYIINVSPLQFTSYPNDLVYFE